MALDWSFFGEDERGGVCHYRVPLGTFGHSEPKCGWKRSRNRHVFPGPTCSHEVLLPVKSSKKEKKEAAVSGVFLIVPNNGRRRWERFPPSWQDKHFFDSHIKPYLFWIVLFFFGGRWGTFCCHQYTCNPCRSIIQWWRGSCNSEFPFFFSPFWANVFTQTFVLCVFVLFRVVFLKKSGTSR